MEEDDEVLAFLEGFLSPSPLPPGWELLLFVDEEGRWTGALFLEGVLVDLDWDFSPEEVRWRVCRRYSSSS
ncbi:hypothetical protein [Thermus hydrothermalis]|uniref:hypothetical protein n=1 Tax=Thermus hydrothermalis TaxID=2908148 RepID=UPI001FA9F956|nr:hypothetical protein [Thermus hydrothermalis]